MGTPGSGQTEAMIEALNRRFIPNKVVLFRPLGEASPAIDVVAGFIKNHGSIEGKPTAYVCRNNACEMPTTDIQEMLDLIK